ncbi:hypothetical protein N7491_008355 [Penicillium cf. griseofulvum]|nr:hypothetical protein N7491_008355 [Penicillium cf. griseofulvum]
MDGSSSTSQTLPIETARKLLFKDQASLGPDPAQETTPDDKTALEQEAKSEQEHNLEGTIPVQEAADRLKSLETSSVNSGLWTEARKELDEELKAIQDSRLETEVNGKKHNLRKGVEKVLDTLRRFEPIIKAATAAEFHASLAWGGISAFLPLLSSVLSQTDNIIDDLNRISNILVKFRAIELLHDLSESKSTGLTHIRHYHNKLRSKTIELYQKPIGDISGIKKLEEVANEFLKALDSGAIQTISGKLTSLQDEVSCNLELTGKTYETTLDISQRLRLDKLPKAERARFDDMLGGSGFPRCHEKTRREVLNFMRNWADGKEGENCMFWLRGMAGTGKSTIARTFAQGLDDEGRVGASFFFSRGQEDRARAGKFFPTLALELSEKVSGFGNSLYNSILKNGSTENIEFKEQWRCLIFEPLEDLGSSLLAPLYLVLVIDALDECQGVEAVPHLIDLLLTAKGLEMIQLRVLVTGRNETHIVESFSGKPNATWLSLEDESIEGTTERDISIYDSRDPTTRLTKFLKAARTTDKATASLDKMYRHILHQMLTEGSDVDEINEFFKPVVGTILVSKEPISVSEMDELLSIGRSNIRLVLDRLTSFLIVQNETSPIQLFHLSFRDFLVNEERCHDKRILIHEAKAHGIFFDHCLKRVSSSPKQDICGINYPGTLVFEIDQDKVIQHIPRTLQYGCQYWVLHLKDACISHLGTLDTKKASEFLNIHLLHWIEVLAIIRKPDEAVTSIIALDEVALGAMDHYFEKFVKDAYRFILYHISVIKEAPLQVYYMASIFTPSKSLVRKAFSKRYPSWIRKSPAMESHRSMQKQVLQRGSRPSGFACLYWNPNAYFYMRTFQPPRHLIVLSGWKYTDCFLCDDGQYKESQSIDADCLTHKWYSSISNDGKTMALYGGKRVHIGNTETKRMTHILDYDLMALQVNLSATKATFMLMDHTTQVFDMVKDHHLKMENIQDARFNCLALSADGTKLAWVSTRGLGIRNLDSEQEEDVLRRVSIAITRVAFFPCGKKLMISSPARSAVQIWDIEQPDVQSKTIGLADCTLFLNIDGIKLAFRHHASNTQYYDIIKEEPITDPQSSMAFDRSYDVHPLMDISEELSQGEVVYGHPQLVRKYEDGQLPLHSDGTHRQLVISYHLASFHLEVVCVGNGQCVFDVHRPSERLYSACLSHDPTMVAVRLETRVDLWGIQIGYLKNFESSDGARPVCIRFSPRDTKLAIGWENNIVSIHNVATDEIQRLQASASLIYSLRFSPDDKLIEEHFYTLDHSAGWIIYDNKKVLALPLIYRPLRADSGMCSEGLIQHRANSIAYRAEAGRVVASSSNVCRMLEAHGHGQRGTDCLDWG